MTWNARNQTLTFWEGLTGSGWLVTSIEKICHGLGITLSQYFEEDTAVYQLTEEEISILTMWDRLSPSQRIAILDLIQAFLPE